MSRRATALSLAAGISVGVIGIRTAHARPHARAADQIRETDIEWSKAGAAKDLERVMSFYTEDAVMLGPNAPMSKGKAAIRSVWAQLMAAPGFALSWQPTRAEASRGGDLGYTIGTYELTTNDPAGQPHSDRGKYAEIWKKQPDGTWKAVVDTFNSDLPPPAATVR